MKRIMGKNGVSHCWARSGSKASICYLISIILCWGKRDCAVHCTMFPSIPSFYLLDVSCVFSPVVAKINCVQTLQRSLERQNHSWLRTAGLGNKLKQDLAGRPGTGGDLAGYNLKFLNANQNVWRFTWGFMFHLKKPHIILNLFWLFTAM